MKICSACGAQAAPEKHHCRVCGAASFFYVCESCGVKFESYRCPQCGAARDAHERICPNCGRHTFELHCPDCRASLRNVSPVRAEIPKETYAVHAEEAIYAADQTAAKPSKRKRAGAVSVIGMVFVLLGFWSAGDIGLASLSFLVPGALLLLAGWCVMKPHNRRSWPLVVGAALLAVSAVILLLQPGGVSN